MSDRRSMLEDFSYKKLLTIDSFGDRLNYLSLYKRGYRSPRHMSNPFYKSRIWRDLREEIIARDLGYDLGVPGIQIPNKQDIIVHHMVPLEEDDILEWREDIILNPDLLITTSRNTHNIIHYGDRSQSILIERQPGDTKLW